MTARLSAAEERLLSLALDEDLGPGDLTSDSLLGDGTIGIGAVVAREPVVVSGITMALAVFRRVDPSLRVDVVAGDGEAVPAGGEILRVEGPLGGLLTAERTALNFLQRLSGIATHTRRHVEALGEGRTRLLDTRKTTPGWRSLEKAAVRHGGGHNHRHGLFDGVMIKDNHLAAVGSIGEAVARARARIHPLVRVEVEVEDLAGLEAALAAGADMVLLDNMDDAMLAEAVRRVAGRIPLEASGGVTLERLPRIAATGVDFVSVGALTHSAPAVDLALDL